MAFVIGNFLGNVRRFYFQINQTRSFLLCKRTSCYLRNNSFPICSYAKYTPPNSIVCANRLSFLRCGKVRTACPRTGPLQTQWGPHFHTSTPRRALPAPLLWMLLKPLQKLLAILLGRSVRKWWVALPDNRRQLVHEWIRRRRWHLAAGAGVTLVIVALLLLTHLDESPVTGRLRLLVFSRDKYMELAALTSEVHLEEFAERLLPVTDPLHQMVEQSVQLLAQRNKDIPEVSEVPWSVHVVEGPQINAFVLPNGKVFVFTGMLGAVADVDQLMIVLGHEMAHAILDHSAEQASLSHVVDLLALILVTAIWALCPTDSLALLGGWAKDKLIEALELRETCACPALPPTDPRAVFSKTVNVLLEKAKEQGVRGLEGIQEPQTVSDPAGRPFSQTVLPSAFKADRLNKDRVPAVTSALPSATGEGSQRVLQNISQQGS
ncbi:PREDICTED: metalloendopeptidase OMA1, mitochondrial [Cyprinodon variegatus]|uniref:metalloendopeptidase OMA1, mitochondrial n=1 Tax=Cyprinodon variegatus TaxID=28743 RepID=UPI0007427190|nr:PREDICTED: metalloendopeptidase OMA1, mitochondrial [Cyprinodon variegatus]